MALLALWNPNIQFLKTDGTINAGGKLVVTDHNDAESIPANYSDADGTTLNASPIVIDALGRATCYIDDGSTYDLYVKDANGATLWTVTGMTPGTETIVIRGGFSVSSNDRSVAVTYSADLDGVTNYDLSIQKEIDRATKAEKGLSYAIEAEKNRAEEAESTLSGSIAEETERAIAAEKASRTEIVAGANITVEKTVGADGQDVYTVSGEDNLVDDVRVNGASVVTDKVANIDVPVAGTASPLMDGNASVGNSLKYAREDHIHPSDTSREDKANKTTVVLGTSNDKYPTDEAVAKFVNSSIATNTANYISNNGEPFTSVEQLEAYSGPVTNNDYAFVTGTDSEGNTYYDRYKATVKGSSVTWALEYRLNNSSFTAAQWSAINSGITSALVAKIHTHSNKDVLDSITSSDVANWNSKQNRLTAGDNITIDGNTISSDQVFVAKYGTTKYKEVKDAYDAGKICITRYGDVFGQLYAVTHRNIRFCMHNPVTKTALSYNVDTKSNWTSVGYTAQPELTFDTAPKAGSTNPVTSGGIKTAIDSAAGSATAKKFTGYNTSNIVTGSWYIIALKNGGASEWERLYEFLIGSNDNSAEQMRVLFSPRISANGKFDDSKVFISGHIIKNTSLLANWKFATLKDTAGTTYTALCVKGTNSTSSRSVYWNVRSVRGNNDWKPVSINLDTTTEYNIVSELPFNGANSLPNCITTDTVTMNIQGNEFNASLPITSGAIFGYLTDNACKPSKAIMLSCGGSNITETGGSWTSTWRQKDCQLSGNGMLDVTADFGINIINQHTYVSTLTSGTCKLCDWDGNVVASAEFSMPNHINNTLVYTVTDNISLRFVVPSCNSNFINGLKVVITLPHNYTIDNQVNISNFTLSGTYWRNGTGYNSNAINYDS